MNIGEAIEIIPVKLQPEQIERLIPQPVPVQAPATIPEAEPVA